MRTFGPGSLSSVLKTGLDVAYALLWAAAAALALTVAAALLSLPFAGAHAAGPASGPVSELSSLARRGPQTTAAVVGAALYLAALIVVADRLRRVFGAMTAGDPFHPDNVGRMRVIGLAMIALEVAAFGLRMAASALFPSVSRPGFGVNLTAWFAILVVFVLAEVFREGARLRAEAELTV